LKAGGEFGLSRGTRDVDAARLQRFAQNLEHAPVKFGELVDLPSSSCTIDIAISL
jgi:hypothetical protein